MIESRQSPSCCALGNIIYAFSGYNTRESLRSIEKLDVKLWLNSQSGNDVYWQDVQIPEDFQAISYNLSTPIDDSNIILVSECRISNFNVNTNEIKTRYDSVNLYQSFVN